MWYNVVWLRDDKNKLCYVLTVNVQLGQNCLQLLGVCKVQGVTTNALRQLVPYFDTGGKECLKWSVFQ